MNMFLIEMENLSADATVARLTDDQSAHLTRVLKKGPGDTVRIGRLNGAIGEGTVLPASSSTVVSLQCHWTHPATPRSGVHLLLACPRPKVMRRLWAQLAALRIDRIWIVAAEKVERYYFDSHVLEPETYGPLLREGLQQAVHTAMPEVRILRSFRKTVEDELGDIPHRILLDPRAPQSLSPFGPRPLWLAIGPEGGWNAFEQKLMIEQGFQSFALMESVLRSDTAIILAAGIASMSPV